MSAEGNKSQPAPHRGLFVLTDLHSRVHVVGMSWRRRASGKTWPAKQTQVGFSERKKCGGAMRPSVQNFCVQPFVPRCSELQRADSLCIFRTEGGRKKRAIPQRDRVQVGRHLRVQSGYTGRTCVCQLSITVLAATFSSPQHSPHIARQRSRCHLTEDQNSESVTHTPGTDGLCGPLMISAHIVGLFL